MGQSSSNNQGLSDSYTDYDKQLIIRFFHFRCPNWMRIFLAKSNASLEYREEGIEKMLVV